MRGSLGICCLHPLNVLLADHFMLHDRTWIVFTHNAACCLLDTAWSLPGLVDILRWEFLQEREVLPATYVLSYYKDVKYLHKTSIIHEHFYLIKVRVLLNVVSIFVRLLSKGNRGVDPEELMEEGTR